MKRGEWIDRSEESMEKAFGDKLYFIFPPLKNSIERDLKKSVEKKSRKFMKFFSFSSFILFDCPELSIVTHPFGIDPCAAFIENVKIK
jgi:hypothetical protein